MTTTFIQTILDAETDATAFSEFVQGENGQMIERRLAPAMHTLQHYLDYFERLKDTGTSVVLKNTEVDANRQMQDKQQIKNILFVGDSLTEPHTDSSYSSPRESYARVLADMIALVSGGYKQVGYVSLSTQNAKDLKSQISITRAGFTDMWGDSDHKWGQLPYRHSPDGRGFYTTSSSTSDYIFVDTTSLISATKIRIYYLKQKNGGQIRFGYSSQSSGNRLLIDTNAETDSLGVAEIEVKDVSNRLIISASTSNTPIAVYGIEFIDDNANKGITYNVFARSGSMLQEHNELASMPTYYKNLAPDTVFLNIGTNDALQDFSRLSANDFKTQLQIWIERITSALPNAIVYLIEPNRADIYGVNDATGEGLLLKAYTDIRRQVADNYSNVVFIDTPLIAGDYDYFYNSDYMLDALHPNAQGKYHIARKLFEILALDVSPAVGYASQNIQVSPPAVELTPKYGKTTISNNAVTIAKFGLVGSAINAYFDIDVSLSSSGKLITGRLQFYALKTNQSDSLVYDVRGVVSDLQYRYDANSSITTVVLNAFKNNDGLIEVTARTDGNWTANEWALKGTTMAAAQNFLVELTI